MQYNALLFTAAQLDYMLGGCLKDQSSKTFAIGISHINNYKIGDTVHKLDIPNILGLKQDASLTALEFIKTLTETNIRDLNIAMDNVRKAAARVGSARIPMLMANTTNRYDTYQI